MALSFAVAFNNMLDGTDTISSVPIGTASSDRVVFAKGYISATDGAPSGLKIGGVDAVFHFVANESAGPYSGDWIASAAVPTGTTATFAFQGGLAYDYCNVAQVGAITGGADVTPSWWSIQRVGNTGYGDQTHTPANGSLTAGGASRSANNAINWTGLTEDAEQGETLYGYFHVSIAHSSNTGSSLTVGADLADDASWGAATFVQSASYTGTGAATLTITASGTGTRGQTGTGAATLSVTASGSGTHIAPRTGTGAATLVLTASGAGARGHAGTASATLGLTASGSGTFGNTSFTGTAAATLGLANAGSGAHGTAGNASALLSILASGNAIHVPPITGAGSTTLTMLANGQGSVPVSWTPVPITTETWTAVPANSETWSPEPVASTTWSA